MIFLFSISICIDFQIDHRLFKSMAIEFLNFILMECFSYMRIHVFDSNGIGWVFMLNIPDISSINLSLLFRLILVGEFNLFNWATKTLLANVLVVCSSLFNLWTWPSNEQNIWWNWFCNWWTQLVFFSCWNVAHVTDHYYHCSTSSTFWCFWKYFMLSCWFQRGKLQLLIFPNYCHCFLEI